MKKAGLFFLIFVILLININFISASREYTLKVTGEHPFYANNEWVKVKDLKIGDSLLTDDGKKARITSIKEIIDDIYVYNLQVNNVNDYYAGGVLVHNKADKNKILVDNENLFIKTNSKGELQVRVKKINGRERVDRETITIGEDAVLYYDKVSGKWKIAQGSETLDIGDSDIGEFFVDVRTGEGYVIDEIKIPRKLEAYEARTTDSRGNPLVDEYGNLIQEEYGIYKDRNGYYREMNSKSRISDWFIVKEKPIGFYNEVSGKRIVFINGENEIMKIEVDIFDDSSGFDSVSGTFKKNSQVGLIFQKDGRVLVLLANGNAIEFNRLKEGCPLFRFIIIDKWDKRLFYVTDNNWMLRRGVILGGINAYGKPIVYYKDGFLWLRLENPLTREIKHVLFSNELFLNDRQINFVTGYYTGDQLIWDNSIGSPVVVLKDGTRLTTFPEIKNFFKEGVCNKNSKISKTKERKLFLSIIRYYSYTEQTALGTQQLSGEETIYTSRGFVPRWFSPTRRTFRLVEDPLTNDIDIVDDNGGHLIIDPIDQSLHIIGPEDTIPLTRRTVPLKLTPDMEIRLIDVDGNIVNIIEPDFLDD